MKRVLFGILALLIQLSNGFPSNNFEGKVEGRDVVEGDMLFFPELLKTQTKSGFKAIYENNIWMTKKIPYEFDESTGHTDVTKKLVRDAMNFLTDATSSCIQFVEHTNEPNYVVVKANTDKCLSDVGKKPTPEAQTLWMDTKCHVYALVHELMHTLGFQHEHTRYDRDDFVRINFDNVKDGQAHNFELDQAGVYDYYGVPYDYDSIMHYRSDSFGKDGPDGKPMTTMTATQEGAVFGQEDHLSEGDLKKIKAMYNCTG